MTKDDEKKSEIYRAQFASMVTVSFGFTCGHNQKPSKPVKALDANTIPGGTIICDRCNEYALVDRITIRLVDPKAMTNLLALGMDEEEHFADEVLSRQAREKKTT